MLMTKTNPKILTNYSGHILELLYIKYHLESVWGNNRQGKI